MHPVNNLMHDVELVATFWTIAGDMTPLSGRPASEHDFVDRVAQAAKAGFRGFGLWPSDVHAALNRHSLVELKAVLADHDIKHVEIEGLLPWYARLQHPAEYQQAARPIFEIAEQFAVRHIKVGGPVRPGLLPGVHHADRSIGELTECFAMLCADLQNIGTSAALELMAVSTLCKLDDVVQIVTEAGAKNGGLLLDAWHITKSDIDYARLGEIPGHIVRYVELADGDAGHDRPLIDDCLSYRKLCGTGDFDVRRFVAEVRRTGYQGPYGVEIFSAVLRKMPLIEAVNSVYQTTIEQFLEAPDCASRIDQRGTSE
jgi:sugar phosphate isomerase/epimerase